MLAPDEVTGTLKLWLDPDAESGTYSDGNTYTTFTDQSGNASNFTVWAGTPLYKTGGVNGHAYCQYDGSSEHGGSVLSAFGSNTTQEWYVVAKVIDTNTNFNTSSNFYKNDALISAHTNFGLVLRDDSGTITLNGFHHDGNEDTVGIVTDENTSVHVYHIRHESGNLYISIDGGVEQSVASGNTTSVGNNARIGTSSVGNALQFDGYYVLAYSTNLSTADRTALIAWLKNRFSIS
jgi:hypothetical protein